MRKLQHKHFLHYLISFAASQIIFFLSFVLLYMGAWILFYAVNVCIRCLFMTLFKGMMEQNFSRFSCWFLNSGTK